MQLGAYFALVEVSDLLRYAIEQQLREVGGLTFVRFQILMRLRLSPTGSHRMTDLADAIVHSRSGLTYQAGLLEKAGLVARALVATVLPGHEEVVGQILFEPLSRADAQRLADLLEPVRDHMRAAPPRSAEARRRRT